MPEAADLLAPPGPHHQLCQAQLLEWTAIRYRHAADAGVELPRSRRGREGVGQIDGAGMVAERRDHVLRDQLHADLPIFIWHRSLNAENYQRARPQHAQNGLQLRDDVLRTPDYQLQRALRLLITGNEFLPDRFRIDFLFFALPAQLVAADSEPTSLRLLGHPSNRIFRVVARRHRMLHARERILSAAK